MIIQMLCKQVLPHDSLHIHAKLQQQTADRLNLYRNGGYVGEYWSKYTDMFASQLID